MKFLSNESGQALTEAAVLLPLVVAGFLLIFGLLGLNHFRVKFDGLALESAACMAREIPQLVCEYRAKNLYSELVTFWGVRLTKFYLSKRKSTLHQRASFEWLGLRWSWRAHAIIPTESQPR